MTNPNNALGTNAALGGRTSVDAFNDAISSLTRGVVSGFAVTPSSAMTLNVGGTAGVRDVAVAVSPNGNRVSVDNRTTSPIKVTMAAASASSARIDAIVAYVNSPSQVTETAPDNPTACGIIPVSGTTSAQPTDSAIRTAISADGGTGSTAYYAIIAIVRLAANTTTITSNMITMQKSRIADSLVSNDSIANKAVTSDKVDWTTFAEPWQMITLNGNAKVGNPNYHTQNNRWRYLQGRQFVEIELNVGPADGSQVSAGTQFIFADISQAPFLKNGWVRISGTGQSSTLGAFEFNKVSGQTNNIRYVPVTGATSYLACHEIIPNPSA